MRVALVHLRHAYTGGTERYLNLLAAFLAERGDEVTIVCRSHERPPHPSVRFEELRPIAIGATARMKSFAQAVEQHVAASSYDVVYGLGKTWTHDVVRLGGGCQATYIELAHSATLKPWERALQIGEGKLEAALAIEKKALAPGNYQRVVVNSRMVARDVQARHGVPAEKIDLVYNGADLERYAPALRATSGAALRKELGLGASEFVVLFLGSGYGRKGLDVVLAGFADAARVHAQLRLLVVGHDSDQPRYETMARKMGLVGRVCFLGGRRDTEACYAASELYVLPTRYDPFANTTIEALASGVPVITSANNGASELLDGGGAGTVLPNAGDAKGVAEGIRSWCDPAHWQRGATAARAVAEKHSARAKCAESAAILDHVARSKQATRDR